MTNISLEEMTLGPAAFDYVRQVLQRRSELCKSLQRKLVLEAGQIKTYLPADLTVEAINKFRVGGKLPQSTEKTLVPGGYTVPIPNLDDVLISRIQSHLNASDSSFCVFENAAARPSYPWVQRLTRVHTAIYGEDVYHFLTSEDKTSPELIQLTTNTARSAAPPGRLICAGMSLSPDVFANGTMGAKELDKIAEHTQELYIGAYDGEGFLIWSRNLPGPPAE